MKYLILILLFVGCKHTAVYNGKTVEYDEHNFAKQVDVYNGDRIIKKFKYISKKKTYESKFLKKYTTEREHSCSYSGYCRHYSYSKKKRVYGFSSSCDGDRYEKREYTVHTKYPKLTYSSHRSKLTLELSSYESSDYITLKRGKCD